MGRGAYPRQRHCPSEAGQIFCRTAAGDDFPAFLRALIQDFSHSISCCGIVYSRN